MKKYLRKFSITFFILTILLTINGCAVRYVADYDAAIKDEIIQIAKKVDLFWGALLDTEPDKRKYAAFKDQYNAIESDMRGLVMKNDIRELNDASTKQAVITLDLWSEDRSMHKKNDNFSNFIAKRHRKQFNRIFIAMAKGEDIKNTTGD